MFNFNLSKSIKKEPILQSAPFLCTLKLRKTQFLLLYNYFTGILFPVFIFDDNHIQSFVH